MASKQNETNLEDLLKTLCFEKYYPEKLSRQEIHEITELSIKEPINITPDTLSWHFIYHLTRYNYNVRGLKVESPDVADDKHAGYLRRKRIEKAGSASNVHPLDVLTVVYLCCNPVAKQDLAKYFWGCKIAVPLILHSEDSFNLYIWPLRSLISKWHTVNESSSIECPIVSQKMPKVAFIRYGENRDSKSALINNIIGGPEKAHPIFFHRDMNGSKKQRSLVVEGMVEIGWYLNKGDKTDRFDTSIMFANLRGDAASHPNQAEILSCLVDIVVILTKTKKLEYVESRVNQMIKINPTLKIIILLEDTSIGDTQEKRIEAFIQTIEEKCSTALLDEKLEILTNEGKRLAEKTDALSSQIKKMLNENCSSIEESVKSISVRAQNYRLEIDEISNADINKGLKYSLRILTEIKEIPPEKRKKICLPLQGDLWAQWVERETENQLLEPSSEEVKDIDVIDRKEQIEKEKYTIRRKQMDLIHKLPYVLRLFIWVLCYKTGNILSIFLRHLKLELDQLSRETLSPYISRYQQIVAEKSVAGKERNEELNKEIERHEKLKSDLSIGLEHFCRELGQIYEAYHANQNISEEIELSSTCRIAYTNLPYFATKILLLGYPLEIMDGDLGYVPQKWVSAALQATDRTLESEVGKKVRVHIVSVLGIQSSGKSTMLNTMFGPMFAVSAGRCTKGVFMQMIKMRTEINCDYLILIDTEGLKSGKSGSVKFDNEISCFAIGLADKTIVNLMGENLTYLQENLPVVVHAFLRMDMVGLSPMCAIVHHNVDKGNREKLIEQGQILERVLNEHTRKACTIERISPHKTFNEIIKFNIGDYTDYVPGLFEGHQPMAAVSLGYSQECDLLRRKIIDQINLHSRKSTLGQFQVNLSRLWKAIKMDDFVFAFRSIIEAEARVELDNFYCDVSRQFSIDLGRLTKEASNAISEGDTSASSEEYISDLEKDFIGKCTVLEKELKTKITEYIFQSPVVSKLQWKDQTLKRFSAECNEAKSDELKKIREQYNENKGKILFENLADTQMEEIVKLTRSELHKSERSTWAFFRDSMLKKTKEQCVEFMTPRLEGVVVDIVFDIFKMYKNRIQSYMQRKTFTEFRLSSLNQPYKGNIVKKKFAVRKLLKYDSEGICEEFTAEVINTTQQYLQKIKVDNKTTYSQPSIRTLFFEIKRIIHMNDSVVAKDLIVHVLVSVCGEVIHDLSTYYSVEARMERFASYLDKNKAMYIYYIRSNTVPSAETERVAQTVADVIKKSIVEASQGTLKMKMAKEIGKNQLKPLLFTRMLLKALENSDRKLLDKYLISPEASLVYHLSKYCVDTNKLEQTGRGVVMEVKSTTLLKVKQISCDVGLARWLSRVRWSLKLDNEHLFGNLIVDSVDVGQVREIVSQEIEALREEEFVLHIRKNKIALKGEIARKVADEFVGCTACCPFCNEICKFRSKNHPGAHEALMHRPVASMGFHYRDTKQLAVGTCDMFVASKYTVTVKEQTVPFKDYKLIFSDWLICGSNMIEASIFWKWYFATNRDTILARNKDLHLKIPESWKNISVESVMENLKQLELEHSLLSDFRQGTFV